MRRCVKINSLHGDIDLGYYFTGHALHCVFNTALNRHTDRLNIYAAFDADINLNFDFVVQRYNPHRL